MAKKDLEAAKRVKEAVIRALQRVKSPFLPFAEWDVFSLGMIYNVSVDYDLSFRITIAGCPAFVCKSAEVKNAIINELLKDKQLKPPTVIVDDSIPWSDNMCAEEIRLVLEQDPWIQEIHKAESQAAVADLEAQLRRLRSDD